MLKSRDRKTLVAWVATLSFLVGCSGNEVANLPDGGGEVGTLDVPQFVALANSAAVSPVCPRGEESASIVRAFTRSRDGRLRTACKARSRYGWR